MGRGPEELPVFLPAGAPKLCRGHWMLGKQMLGSCLKRKQIFLVKGQQEFLTAEPSLQPLVPSSSEGEERRIGGFETLLLNFKLHIDICMCGTTEASATFPCPVGMAFRLVTAQTSKAAFLLLAPCIWCSVLRLQIMGPADKDSWAAFNLKILVDPLLDPRMLCRITANHMTALKIYHQYKLSLDQLERGPHASGTQNELSKVQFVKLYIQYQACLLDMWSWLRLTTPLFYNLIQHHLLSKCFPGFQHHTEASWVTWTGRCLFFYLSSIQTLIHVGIPNWYWVNQYNKSLFQLSSRSRPCQAESWS